MKTDLFQSCGHCWVFQICWHIECSTFTVSSSRIWNSWTGIPSPPLALFVVMLSKAHWTSHSRMSGSWWVITPVWLSGLWRSFLYSLGLLCILCVVLYFMYVCVYTTIYIYIYIYTCVYMYILNIYIGYIYMYILDIYINICIHIHTYIHIHTHPTSFSIHLLMDI